MNIIRTPFINVWNPICKRYQWLRILNTFSISDTYKMYNNDTNVYVTVLNENNQSKCTLNKYLIFTDSQVYRTTHPPNNWVNKIKTFPGNSDIDMIDLYKKIKEKYPRYVKFEEPIQIS